MLVQYVADAKPFFDCADFFALEAAVWGRGPPIGRALDLPRAQPNGQNTPLRNRRGRHGARKR